jgi:uncharacterized protein (UPF0276 family)
MKLAINYSTQAAALLAAGKIQLDRFKCPDWPDMIAEAQTQLPVAVHFTLTAGSGKLKKTADWDFIAGLLDQTHTPYVNLHLSPTLKYFPDYSVDKLSHAQSKKVFKAMRKDVRAAVREFGPERVIVENVPYRGSQDKVFRTAVEPQWIGEIVEDTGCGLLLDISHARISAHQLGVDACEYMEQLPIEKIKELHFTGLHDLDGYLQDHLSILEADWPFLEWALDRIHSGRWAVPWLLAFEYGGVGDKFAGRSDPAVIADQLPRIYHLMKERNEWQ